MSAANDELERLRAELAGARDIAGWAEAERDALKAAVERVRAVHVISDLGECTDCRASWPCPTIAALAAPESHEDAS